MRQKLKTKQIFLLVLLVNILLFFVTNSIQTYMLAGSINVKQGVIFKTSSNNAQLTMGADFVFSRVEINFTHLWLDKSYTAHYYTRYCIYVNSPNNVQLSVNTWFATKDSSATLTITSPTSTNIAVGFTSPNLLTASVIGEVAGTESWDSSTKTLTFTVNTDVSSTFTITVTVTETKEDDLPPENVGVTITDLEGCGAWVFSEESYYTFQAKYLDYNGHDDLDTMKIKFSDGVNTIIAVYDQPETEWSLESGSDVVRLKAGTAIALDANLLQVTFLIYFQNTVLDALDVDIYAWCNDTSGSEDNWQLMQEDYFNIYNLGGHSTLTTSGSAGRLTGGDVFDLWCEENSWANASMTFRDLQHVKFLPMLNYVSNASAAVEPNPDDGLYPLQVKFYINYCVDDVWTEGWSLVIQFKDAGAGSTRWWRQDAEWYNHGVLVKNETYYTFWRSEFKYEEFLWKMNIQFWVDLWFNKQNASSTFGGRVNAYYFPMKDTSNDWLRWLVGSNWGPDEEKRKQSMYFDRLSDENWVTIYAPQIEMVSVGVRIKIKDNAVPEGYYIYAELTDYDVFDLTLGGTPLEGIATPVFDETRVPLMPQGGFLGAVVTALTNLGKRIAEAFGPVLLGLWNAFVGFLDTVFTAFGWPNGFSQILSWIDNLKVWLVNSFTYLISFLTSAFAFILAIASKMLNTLSTMVTQWVAIVQGIFGMLGDSMNTGVHLWNDLNLSTWVVLIAIMYPVYLMVLWDQKGIDAPINHVKMLIDIGAFIARIFITVIQLFLNIIGRIIESIPIVE